MDMLAFTAISHHRATPPWHLSYVCWHSQKPPPGSFKPKIILNWVPSLHLPSSAQLHHLMFITPRFFLVSVPNCPRQRAHLTQCQVGQTGSMDHLRSLGILFAMHVLPYRSYSCLSRPSQTFHVKSDEDIPSGQSSRSRTIFHGTRWPLYSALNAIKSILLDTLE
ncbi:hypothetical protein BS17DRAFT_200887 [Gyrodon lividus]|nr:hypothetical protein BS17DRAFT_200887 [Gyrodon lividus]